MKKIILSSLLMAAICFVLPASLKAQVTVPANKAWTKTTITVKNGDKVTVTASGTITLDVNVTTGPDGLKVSATDHCAIRGANRGAIIGRVGKKGVPFAIGANGTLSVAGDGILYLGINDDNVKNNSGSYTVTVKVN